MASSKPPASLQYACLPFRQGSDGHVEIALVTSRESGRWVLPKGWPMRGKKPHAAAAAEALEEAGLVGDVARAPIGRYMYRKRLRDGSVVPCEVMIYPMRVTSRRKKFRERGQRILCGMSDEEAAEAVVEPGLKALFGEVESLLLRQSGAVGAAA